MVSTGALLATFSGESAMQISDLLACVDAGGTPGAHDITIALRPIYDGDEPVVAYFRMACDGTDIRAMGAAKALHEAVLPGWHYSIDGMTENGCDAEVFTPPEPAPQPGHCAGGRSDSPLRHVQRRGPGWG